MGIYTKKWADVQGKIYAALPEEHKSLVYDLEEEFRKILRNRNEKIKELMDRCGDSL